MAQKLKGASPTTINLLGQLVVNLGNYELSLRAEEYSDDVLVIESTTSGMEVDTNRLGSIDLMHEPLIVELDEEAPYFSVKGLLRLCRQLGISTHEDEED
jgi:hypothetical protein